MAGCRWMDHRGCRILLVSYGGCLTDPEMLKVLEEQRLEVLAAAAKVRVVHDYTDAFLSEGFVEESKRLSKESREAVFEKVAMVGLSGVRRVLVLGYRIATGDTSSRAFDTLGEALDWVVT